MSVTKIFSIYFLSTRIEDPMSPKNISGFTPFGGGGDKRVIFYFFTLLKWGVVLNVFFILKLMVL